MRLSGPGFTIILVLMVGLGFATGAQYELSHPASPPKPLPKRMFVLRAPFHDVLGDRFLKLAPMPPELYCNYDGTYLKCEDARER